MDGATRDDLLQRGYLVEFQVVHPSYQPLRVLQCVWPDRQQRYPWDPQVDQAIRERQPVLVGSGSPGVDRP